MLDIPAHVRPSEWFTALVLATASGGVAVRVSGVYPAQTYGGIVALLLAINVFFVWSLFYNNSLRRQRALDPGLPSGQRK